MLRKVLGAVAGILAGGIVTFLLQMLGHRLFPLPAGVDPSNPESLKAALAAGQVSASAMVAVLVSYVGGAFSGGFTAAKIGRALGPALTVGAVQTVFGIINLFLLPHPWWMWVGSLLSFLPFAFLGGKVAHRE